MQLKKGCKLWWIALLAIAIDRISKQIVLTCLAPMGVKTALPGVLSWAFTRNRGAAFGMMSGQVILLPLTILLISALLIWMLRHPESGKMMRSGLWMIIGGGLGNLWDRIVYGFVVDFIRLDFINFAIFNLADVFICTGAGIVALAVLLEERNKKHG